MFPTGPTATSSVNIPVQGTASPTAASRLHFTPFCLPPIDTSSVAPGQLSSSSSSSVFHPSNECSSSNGTSNTAALLFSNQQQQQQQHQQQSLYARYTNGLYHLLFIDDMSD